MLKIEKYNMAIERDQENKQLLAYDFINNEAQERTEGILKEVNEEIGGLIESFFDIKLSDYDVVVVDSEQGALAILN